MQLIVHQSVFSNPCFDNKKPETSNSDQIQIPSSHQKQGTLKVSPIEVDQTVVQTLRLVAEQVKINLTSSESVHVHITSPVLVDLIITQSEFNQMNEDLFRKVLRPIELVLEEASISKDQVCPK